MDARAAAHREFEHDRWLDPKLHAVIDRITLHPDHAVAHTAPTISCTTANCHGVDVTAIAERNGLAGIGDAVSWPQSDGVTLHIS